MIAEIILIIFAIVYYLFSTFLISTYIQETDKKEDSITILGNVLMCCLSPFVVPIILGIKMGQCIKDD